ncbi:VapC toxin family PIN domain ribonuclease [Sphingobium sp. AR-3-1]|uniref:VapC toxin family PIN domain ribonuclease n=1 Tax=Sphingobium psychrophilum TaxID=2728834 RepID=A0A7X9WW76_9SPHN|nr:VapC toxin family PIN domain ribonuclease [Sphingobium psychrophilum]NML11040.1 VapC toxin family PIN domain ribonuclease [Sphingobium psychrophilum]
MILADSSIWMDHLRMSNPLLTADLNAGRILAHPFVIGEIALGSLTNRKGVLGMLRKLPEAVLAKNREVDALIEQVPLFNIGIGYVDTHLLSSVLLTAGSSLWTHNRRLHDAALRLGIAFQSDRPH